MNKIEYELLKDEDGRYYIDVKNELLPDDKFFIYEMCRYMLTHVVLINKTKNVLKQETKDDLDITLKTINKICDSMSEILSEVNKAYNDLTKEINNKNDNKTD